MNKSTVAGMFVAGSLVFGMLGWHANSLLSQPVSICSFAEDGELVDCKTKKPVINLEDRDYRDPDGDGFGQWHRK